MPHKRAVTVYGIEYRRNIHQQHGKYRPKVLDIAEENEKCRQNQAYAYIKQDQTHYRIKQENKFPGKGYAIQNAERKKHYQSKPKVDKRLDIFRKQKQIFGDIDLCKNRSIAQQRLHALRSGFVEIRKYQVAAEKIGGVMLHIAAEKLGENKTHDKKSKQRREYAPRHAQHSSFIFLFKISFYQFFKKELILF